MAKTPISVGMLGAGFIGQMHSLAMRAASYSRAQPALAADLVLLADRDPTLLAEVADRYDWAATTTDWHDLLDARLGLFINAAPNDLHTEPTLAAAQSGIPVFCEKPLACTAEEAYKLWQGTEAYGVMHRCAFMHRFIPAIRLARDMVKAGELGEVRHYRSTFLLNMLNPDGTVSWRFDPNRSGSGALGDLGSHHLDIARFTIGEITHVGALTRTWTTDPTDRLGEVNDDAFAVLATFDTGATAVLQGARTAAAHALTGRVEIDGTRGSLSWSMERLNELVIRRPGQGPCVHSVTRPGHPLEGFWLPGGVQGSHPLGWNECFAHQAHDVLGLASGMLTESVAATFEDGYRVAEVVDTITAAARFGRTLPVTYRTAPSPTAADQPS